MSITLKAALFILLSCSVASCKDKEEVKEVFNSDEYIYVSLDEKKFNIPKKYIDNPSRSVPQRLIFKDDEGMIAYYYWPTLNGLQDNDDQPRFGQINNNVIQMEWKILKNIPVSTAQAYQNVSKIKSEITSSSECIWNDITQCRYSNDGGLATWIGFKNGLGYFWIRCPANEKKEVMEDEICNFSVDYDDKGLYLKGFIGSKYILEDDTFPKILDQNKKFLDQWESI